MLLLPRAVRPSAFLCIGARWRVSGVHVEMEVGGGGGGGGGAVQIPRRHPAVYLAVSPPVANRPSLTSPSLRQSFGPAE